MLMNTAILCLLWNRARTAHVKDVSISRSCDAWVACIRYAKSLGVDDSRWQISMSRSDPSAQGCVIITVTAYARAVSGRLEAVPTTTHQRARDSGAYSTDLNAGPETALESTQTE